jgi:hypothetical protein
MQYSFFRAAATLILGMMSVLACSAWADFAPTQGTTGRFIRVLSTPEPTGAYTVPPIPEPLGPYPARAARWSR